MSMAESPSLLKRPNHLNSVAVLWTVRCCALSSRSLRHTTEPKHNLSDLFGSKSLRSSDPLLLLPSVAHKSSYSLISMRDCGRLKRKRAACLRRGRHGREKAEGAAAMRDIIIKKEEEGGGRRQRRASISGIPACLYEPQTLRREEGMASEGGRPASGQRWRRSFSETPTSAMTA